MTTETKLDIDAIFEILPKSEITLVKRYKSYDFRIANDKGQPCDWFIYDQQNQAVGVVLYRGGKKLCLHGIEALTA